MNIPSSFCSSNFASQANLFLCPILLVVAILSSIWQVTVDCHRPIWDGSCAKWYPTVPIDLESWSSPSLNKVTQLSMPVLIVSYLGFLPFWDPVTAAMSSVGPIPISPAVSPSGLTRRNLLEYIYPNSLLRMNYQHRYLRKS